MVDTKRQQSNPLLEHALAYAARGWLVIPLHEITDAHGCSCSDADCKSQGKHPRGGNGSHHGTTDSEKIRSWWERWPSANVGICTGPESGIFVVGPDGPAGVKALGDLQAEFGELPETPRVRTGGGGQHWYFKWPAGGGISNRRNHNGLPIDVRGEGGYVVAPPSRNLQGWYCWEVFPW
jgi:hypothetical protein